MKLTAILAWAMLASAAWAASPPNLGILRADLDRDGPEKTVELLERADQWEAVLDNIGHGDTAWVSLAPRLAPGTDGASAEGLGIALAHALPVNPSAVLSVTEPGDHGIISIYRVCSTPFIETSKVSNAIYDRRAIQAVSRVSSSDLTTKRDACVARLKS